MSICWPHSMRRTGFRFWILRAWNWTFRKCSACKVDLLEEGRLKPRVQKSLEAEAFVPSSDPSQRIQDILDNIARRDYATEICGPGVQIRRHRHYRADEFLTVRKSDR
jgi:hypothetical protein